MKFKDYKTRRHLLKKNKELERDVKMFQRMLSQIEAENETLMTQISALKEHNKELSIENEAFKIIYSRSKESGTSSAFISPSFECVGVSKAE